MRYTFNLDKLTETQAKTQMKSFLSNRPEYFNAPNKGGVGITQMKMLFEMTNKTFNNYNDFRLLLLNDADFASNATKFVNAI